MKRDEFLKKFENISIGVDMNINRKKIKREDLFKIIERVVAEINECPPALKRSKLAHNVYARTCEGGCADCWIDWCLREK